MDIHGLISLIYAEFPYLRGLIPNSDEPAKLINPLQSFGDSLILELAGFKRRSFFYKLSCWTCFFIFFHNFQWIGLREQLKKTL